MRICLGTWSCWKQFCHLDIKGAVVKGEELDEEEGLKEVEGKVNPEERSGLERGFVKRKDEVCVLSMVVMRNSPCGTISVMPILNKVKIN